LSLLVSKKTRFPLRVLVQAAQDMDSPVASGKTAIAEKYATANAMDMVLDVAMQMRFWRCGTILAIQKAFENRSKFQLPDSASHVLENAPRIAAANYTPSTEDILRCRARTTGIHEILFKVQMFHFRMVDVGGQRSERKKWVALFSGLFLSFGFENGCGSDFLLLLFFRM
jgi:hypothetical protein